MVAIRLRDALTRQSVVMMAVPVPPMTAILQPDARILPSTAMTTTRAPLIIALPLQDAAMRW